MNKKSFISLLVLSSISALSMAERSAEFESLSSFNNSQAELNHFFDSGSFFPSQEEASIALPIGFHPEGIVKGHSSYAYVGSLFDGSIYQLNLITGDGEVLYQGNEGDVTVGMAYDHRTNYVFAAGGPTAQVSVHDGADGEIKATFSIPEAGFINDAIVTKNAVYFTDSFVSVIYKLPLESTGRLTDEVQTIPLTGEFEFVEGQFNWNGIESFNHGRHLILVNSTTGALVKVDPDTGITSTIPVVGGELLTGDGLTRIRNKLYVTKNSNEIAEIVFNPNLENAVIRRTLTNDLFRTLATSIFYKGALYTVNARFDVAPPPFVVPSDRSTEFDIVRTPLIKF